MPDALEDMHIPMPPRGRSAGVWTEPCPKRVRACLGGVAVADSTRVRILFEDNHLPVYYFPSEDVRTDLLEPTSRSSHCPHKGQASYWTVRVGDRAAADAVWGYQEPVAERADIKGHLAFYWHEMDAWYEEDDEVYVHPRDPYTRVDVLHSSRHVRVELDVHTLADTRRPRMLLETGLPVRYYIPRADVRMDLLQPSPTSSQCPYKGVASYWSARLGERTFEDVAWTYRFPVPECPKMEGLVAFFDERVDIWVDGHLQGRPETPWS